MIRARCLHRPGHIFPTSSLDLTGSQRSGHKFYSVFPGATWRHELAGNPIIRPSKSWRFNQSLPQRLNRNLTPRFASTTPTPPPPPQVQSEYVPPPQTATPAEGEFTSASLDEVMSSIPPPVYEHLGFLKELGLDYGWGSTAFVQTVLEHVYIYLGTPWWASIGITVLLTRAILFKSFMDAADMSARRQIIKPLDDPINERIQAARATRDRLAMQDAWKERQVLFKNAGISSWKSLVPLVQIPLGFGVFRLVRGMASLPVPGFDNGGFLWFHDLTVSDPFHILPFIASWGYFFAFKIGGETGGSDLMSEKARTAFQYLIPFGGGVLMLAWPAGLQLTFCITSLLAAVQATLFSSDRFRDLVGMQRKPTPNAPKKPLLQYQAPSSTPSKPETGTGVLGTLKGAVSDVIKIGEKYAPKPKQKAQNSRLTDAEKRHAEKYEKRRQREFAQEEGMRREEEAMIERRQEEKVVREQEREARLQRRAEKKARRKQ